MSSNTLLDDVDLRIIFERKRICYVEEPICLNYDSTTGYVWFYCVHDLRFIRKSASKYVVKVFMVRTLRVWKGMVHVRG